jgi:glycine cleavage system pyridoxal-binding protein P
LFIILIFAQLKHTTLLDLHENRLICFKTLGRDQDLPKMLETIGVESLDQLINETIPADIRLKTLWNWSIL